MKILLCGSDPTTALDLWSLLHEQGHRVCGIVRNSSKCMEKAQQCHPDLVMVDADLGESPTGHELVEALSQSGVRSVILSREPHSMAPAPSARAVLKKPFTQACVASAMARVERALYLV